MKKNIYNRIIIIAIYFILIFFTIGNYTNAFAMGDIISGADNFIQNGVADQNSNPTIEVNELEKMSDLLYNTLLVIAIVVTVIIGLSIGIKFITGSVAQKAEIKETLIPYIAGCIVVFGAFGIWKLIVTIMSQM